MGITPSCRHSAAAFGEFFSACEKGLKNITHFGNRLSPITSREIGATGAGMVLDDVFIEIIADMRHLSADMLRLVFAKKPHSKIVLITDAMRAAWLGGGVSDLGGLKVVVENGAARLASSGALAGSVLKMNEAVKNAAQFLGGNLAAAAALASENAAESLGLKGLGRLSENYAADFVLMGEGAEIRAVFIGGRLAFEA